MTKRFPDMADGLASKMLRFSLLGLAICLSACTKETAAPEEESGSAIGVRTAEVTTTRVPDVYRVPGNVIADDRIQISSRISGFIQKVPVREGDRVAAGDLLVEIDAADVDGLIRRSEAALESASADLVDARRDVEKFAALVEQGGIPVDTLRKSRLRLEVAESRLVELNATLETARSQRRYTRITSPVDGVVIAREHQPGDLATPGLPILVLESSSSLVFQTFVAERRVAGISIGDQVQVGLDAIGETLAGRVLRVVPSGDPVTRRYEVKIAVPSRSALLPGMFGRADFAVGEEGVLVVPDEALTDRLGLIGVFVVSSGSRADFRWVRLRRQVGGGHEVIAGLTPGEIVVLAPPTNLVDGGHVESRIGTNH